MKLTVAIATTGRRDVLTEVVRDLARQSRPPAKVSIAPGRSDDVDTAALSELPFEVELVPGPLGLCAQRNSLLRRLTDAEVILFLDDDFLMEPGYLEACAAVFETHADVAMTTGEVILDGARGRGLDFAAARQALAADHSPATETIVDVGSAFGCNMALRAALVRETGLWFDEALPLYGWLEDLDFSRRLSAHGRIVKSDLCRGVHLGVKKGRTSGVRLGYSQIANPIHISRKGAMRWPEALKLITKNILANFGRSIMPEPWVDRPGRAWGNLLACADMIAGRLDPTRVERLGN